MAKALTRGVPSKLGRGGTTYPLTETNSLSPGVAQEDVEVCVLGGGGQGGPTWEGRFHPQEGQRDSRAGSRGSDGTRYRLSPFTQAIRIRGGGDGQLDPFPTPGEGMAAGGGGGAARIPLLRSLPPDLYPPAHSPSLPLTRQEHCSWWGRRSSWPSPQGRLTTQTGSAG